MHEGFYLLLIESLFICSYKNQSCGLITKRSSFLTKSQYLFMKVNNKSQAYFGILALRYPPSRLHKNLNCKLIIYSCPGTNQIKYPRVNLLYFSKTLFSTIGYDLLKLDSVLYQSFQRPSYWDPKGLLPVSKSFHRIRDFVKLHLHTFRLKIRNWLDNHLIFHSSNYPNFKEFQENTNPHMFLSTNPHIWSHLDNFLYILSRLKDILPYIHRRIAVLNIFDNFLNTFCTLRDIQMYFKGILSHIFSTPWFDNNLMSMFDNYYHHLHNN